MSIYFRAVRARVSQKDKTSIAFIESRVNLYLPPAKDPAQLLINNTSAPASPPDHHRHFLSTRIIHHFSFTATFILLIKTRHTYSYAHQIHVYVGYLYICMCTYVARTRSLNYNFPFYLYDTDRALHLPPLSNLIALAEEKRTTKNCVSHSN